MAPSNTKETEKHCVLCCQEVDIFALGKCDHPVCYRCSTKMRVLCEQKYCAVCREELDKVVFVKKPAAFSSLPYQQFPCEKKHDIYFCDENIYAQYRHLLLPECLSCTEPKVFSKYEELEHHMRKTHELFCCKLCTKHLKIFCHERKWYNRKELARHRAHGDPDDTSHRGHPLCKFCDDRYLDNDELLKHLRRDHYFCHFCDADGSQEYYSDYPYLSEHFRDSHYLCEEGRCATEQFTHAFRSEIDYKAHKAAEHSKNRAEARQNRQIDLQFNYAPRQQGRRNEGMLTGEDYDEMRQARGGRGRLQGGQKSWRYSREDEDRDVAAAVKASMATRRQEERMGAMHERGPPKYLREERVERTEPEEPRNMSAPIKPPVRTMKSDNPGDGEDDFPALGGGAALTIVKPAPATLSTPRAALKEDDFPSLSAVAVSSPMTPAYSAQPKKSSSFQEEDFPALVSKIQPLRNAAGTKSAWSSHAAVAKPASQPPPSSRPSPPLSSVPSGPQLLSASSNSSRKKMKVGVKSASSRSPPSSDDEKGAVKQQQQQQQQVFRSVPTMSDISSLLTVKGGNSKAPTVTPLPPKHAPTPEPPTSKASKKKKQQQQQKTSTAAPSAPVSSTSGTNQTASVKSVETAAQKENVPEKIRNKPPPSTAAVTATMTSVLSNGHQEKSPPVSKKKEPAVAVTPYPKVELPLDQEEDFPALMTKNPPPGFKSSFKSSFPMKTSAPAPASSAMPPPPPGLGLSATKPPPGFTGIPLNSNVVEPAPTEVNPPTKVQSSGYMVPEDFHERNLQLIASIKKYLYNDESKFNQFKNLSAQFRQSGISAVQYHSSCKELLGDDFHRIFNELLVLLPDTGKQQELLAVQGDCRALERQAGAGGVGKKNKNKKNAWQTPSSAANVAAELDCQVCPTCRQVLAPKDFNSHKTLHTGEAEEFPSLQSISRIIS
ncbi:E3 ubiquitin-protein ligase ZNF598 [Pseudochaenichthys georgianus]|uniref:E3 ubiquitin-protein ligase ZNF598 n=1 Tax=Pseudochaenichthys georgianus TaxID=52239 RepID=UPI00146E546D|nr:E3 ubiquitin-protein ligase ZNF598 [Pseudochaenichthys georgianus]